MTSVFPLSAHEWEAVLHLARVQTVIGVAFRGMSYLPEGMEPSMGQMARWMAYADRIEGENRRMNGVMCRLLRHLSAAGVEAVLQKGQGVAMMYPEPSLRQSGDIDLYVSRYSEASALLTGLTGKDVEMSPDGSAVFVMNDIVVEVHQHLLDIASPSGRRYVRKLIEEKGFDEVSVDGVSVKVPAPEVNLLLLSSHILKHVLGKGIGLRQICDMAVASGFYREKVDPEEMRMIYERVGMTRWMSVLDKFIQNYMFCMPEYCKKNDKLLEIILKGGNFGFFGEEGKVVSKSKWVRKWNTFSSFVENVGFAAKVAPKEWFWTMIKLAGGQFR